MKRIYKTALLAACAALTFAALTACSNNDSDDEEDDSYAPFTGTNYEVIASDATNYIISYFKCNYGNYGDSNLENLFLGYSADGLHYTALKNNTYVYKISSTTGSGGQCVRDPYMNRIYDDDTSDSVSKFIYLATDWTWYGNTSYGKAEYGTTGSTSYWGGYSPCIIVSEVHVDTTANTVKFYKPGTTTEGSTCVRMTKLAMHAWAPELIVDYNDDGSPKPIYTKNGNDYYYGIAWSGNGTLTTGGGNNRTFINYTNDFVHFTSPVVFFEDGNEIDVTMQKSGGKYYLFYKDESNVKNLKAAVSDSLTPGSFTVLNNGAQLTTDGIEGPWLVQLAGTWWLFGDHYGNASHTATTNFYGYTASTISAAQWTRHANDGTYSFPAGVRHAFAFKVTEAELAAFKVAFN